MYSKEQEIGIHDSKKIKMLSKERCLKIREIISFVKPFSESYQKWVYFVRVLLLLTSVASVIKVAGITTLC